jgi:hypothetical protein
MLALLLRGDEPTRTGIVVGKRLSWKAQNTPSAGVLLRRVDCETKSRFHSRLRENASRADSAIQGMVGAAGLEPATLGLEIRCSIHLSYAPSRATTEQFYPALIVIREGCASTA